MTSMYIPEEGGALITPELGTDDLEMRLPCIVKQVACTD